MSGRVVLVAALVILGVTVPLGAHHGDASTAILFRDTPVPGGGGRRPRRRAGHDRDLPAVARREVLAQVAEQPARRADVGRIGAIEDQEARHQTVTDGFSTTSRPSARTSICVRRKQSSPSSGRCTIGSFSLNEVFRSTGTPVSFSKVRISRQ